MFEQYWKIRETVREGTLLFYRMGDFYELFGEDAVAAAPALEIQLTARHKDAEVPVPMCGIPAHSWESYGEKLLKRGQKIALCEQTTPPGEGKLVERKVVRILTPGLPVDFRHLDAKELHWLLVIHQRASETFEIVVCDLLSGNLHEGTLQGLQSVLSLIQTIRPKEVLVAKAQLESIQNLLGGLLVTEWDSHADADSLFWSYIEYTQCKPREQLKAIFPFRSNLEVLQSQRSAQYAALSNQVVSQWDIDPHLFALLDACGSAVGSRHLRQILHRPLGKSDRIEWRQQLCKVLDSVAKDFLISSREVYDLERIMGRFRLEVVKPRELLRLTTSLRYMVAALETIDWSMSVWNQFLAYESIPTWLDQKESLMGLTHRLTSALDLEVDLTRSKNVSDLFRKGFDSDLDELREIAQNSEAWLERFEQNLREKLSIPSLKVRHNRVFGFYIEVTKAHAEKIPKDFERRQTMVNAERFSCEELKREEERILSATTRLEDRATYLIEELTKEVLDHDDSLQRSLKLFGFVDAFCGALHSMQKLKRYGDWVSPKVQSGAFGFDIKNGRHPLVEALGTPGSFVPNSLCMNSDLRVIVLTGPNMAGKSTIMRQCGLLLLLAQIGFPVPAESMSFSPCDGFYSRMGASDKILEGDSTFMVEMKETAQILEEATSQSFVLIDEIGRGTSTQDGLAIAQSLLEHLHNRVGACVIFATHYHELSELVPTLPKSVNASMEIREWKGELIFLRKLVSHAAKSSHGIYVAELAGLPQEVLNRAKALFAIPASDAATQKEAKPTVSNSRKNPIADTHQLSMFASAEPQVVRIEVAPEWTIQLQQDLKKLDLNDVTPRQAWELLAQFRSRLPSSD